MVVGHRVLAQDIALSHVVEVWVLKGLEGGDSLGRVEFERGFEEV